MESKKDILLKKFTQITCCEFCGKINNPGCKNLNCITFDINQQKIKIFFEKKNKK